MRNHPDARAEPNKLLPEAARIGMFDLFNQFAPTIEGADGRAVVGWLPSDRCQLAFVFSPGWLIIGWFDPYCA